MRSRSVLLAVLLGSLATPASSQEELRSYAVVRDSIPASLTGQPGDPGRGRAIVANRTVGLCLLCHSGPIPEERFQGNLAPSLAGAGARWSEGQVRLRLGCREQSHGGRGEQARTPHDQPKTSVVMVLNQLEA